MFAFAWIMRARHKKDLFQIFPVIFFKVQPPIHRDFFFFHFVDIQDKGI